MSFSAGRNYGSDSFPDIFHVINILLSLKYLQALLLLFHIEGAKFFKKGQFQGNRQSMCLLQNKCLTPNIVYQSDITNNVDDERRVYLGLSETPFKNRYHNHVRDFNIEIH